MPYLSIIIPTYNRVQALQTTLEEFVMQTFRDFELIVVDDHSSDTTAELIQQYQSKYPNIRSTLNHWQYQRDAKQTGLQLAKGEWISFFDDDIELRDPNYLARIVPKLTSPQRVYQSKIIMEDLGQKNYEKADRLWEMTCRYLPVIDIRGGYKRNYGIADVRIFPLIECGNRFHFSHKQLMIDPNLIKDGYGESIASSLRLLQEGIDIRLSHDTLVYHIGNPHWGSKRFSKKGMIHGFTEFHEGYIYNMIYIHCRWRKWRFWLWMPYFFLKGVVALILNKNRSGWKKYYLYGYFQSLKTFFRY